MSSDHERRLLARARELASVDDLAEDVVSILGGGRAARLDPDALTSLAGAALALGADSLTVYRAEEARFTDDRDFGAAVEDAEDSIAARLQAVRRLQSEVRAARSRARADLAAARARLAAAHLMPVRRPCSGCHQARAEAIARAKARIAACQERLAILAEAAGILAELAAQLRRALACMRRVMTDLADTYEPVYELVRRRGVMPKDGDWLTGEEPRPAAG